MFDFNGIIQKVESFEILLRAVLEELEASKLVRAANTEKLASLESKLDSANLQIATLNSTLSAPIAAVLEEQSAQG